MLGSVAGDRGLKLFKRICCGDLGVRIRMLC